VAGVDEDERAPVEAAVRRALAGRDPAEQWSVSLVRLRTLWSVTLSGPGERLRSVSFTAEEHRLSEAINEAISDGDPAPEEEPPDPFGGVPIEKRIVCEHCRRPILVSYEGQPGEPTEVAPVACPHCWTINRVEIGSGAAVGGDYSADKA
jgi:hypothetical protein